MGNKNKISKEALKGFKEFELAWQEFFKNKPEPKNDEEERKEQEEFHYWYNNTRKQSDTGKTPAEMYKEIYGKEPKNNQKEPSRMMNFEWDDSDEKDEFDEEDKEFEKIADKTAELVTIKNFDDLWKDIEEAQKELPRKDLSKEMYYSGAFDMFCLLAEGMTEYGDKIDDEEDEDFDDEEDEEEIEDENMDEDEDENEENTDEDMTK